MRNDLSSAIGALLLVLSLLATSSSAGEPVATVTAIELGPADFPAKPGESVQVVVTAVFADGSRRDVTPDARIVSTNQHALTVQPGGMLKATGYGESYVVAKYKQQNCVRRVPLVQPLPFEFPELPVGNRIDEHVGARLKELGIPPAELCSDEVFLRRVYLDVVGTLPTVNEARTFLESADANKRSLLIERLLTSEEFADFWALKWSDLLRIKSEYPSKLWPNAVQAYHQWIRASLAENTPYDEFVRELLTSSGSNFRHPPANYYRAFQNKDPRDFADVTALLFMGTRTGCARCHDHPEEDWTPDDELGLAAFFAPVSFKSTTEWKEEIVYADLRKRLKRPATGDPVQARFLDGTVPQVDDQDPRVVFADWLTAAENPWFARNAANRVWCWLLGRGIVHEVDDLRSTNPPANPELLDYLAEELIDHQFDLRHLYRLILSSHTYQRSSRASEWNAHDHAQFSHYYVKRLSAETLLDAISGLTGKWDTYRSTIPEPFVQLPAGFRATHLADGSVGLPFLEMFGRPPRDTAFESDRDSRLSLRQTLHLLNSEDVQRKISGSPRLKQLVNQEADLKQIIEQLYLATLSRRPTQQELTQVEAYFVEQPNARLQSAEDLLWALLNTKEFVFNH